jgi:6-phosphofructokinase
VIPEEKTDADVVAKRLLDGRKKGKRFGIVVVAEGDDSGGAFKLAETVQQKVGFNIRVSVLGHIQRGGSPHVTRPRLGFAYGRSGGSFSEKSYDGGFHRNARRAYYTCLSDRGNSGCTGS